MTARKTALKLLSTHERDRTYTNISLENELEKSELSAADKNLVCALFYGCVQKKITLDYYIKKLSSRPLAKIEPRNLNILRLGLYQLMFMDRIPPHAAINESVNLAKEKSVRGAGFVNALLRSYIREGGKTELPAEKIPRLSVKYSFPEWICESFDKDYGCAEEILAATDKAPDITIRANTLKCTADALCEKLAAHGINCAACKNSKNSVRISDGVSYKKLCDILGGENFFVQDEQSSVAVNLLAPFSGARVCDVCAAPGGKSIAAALEMKNDGEIFSFDIHENKLPLIKSAAQTLGIGIIQTQARDALQPDEKLFGSCDFVICDAPCSGLGVMAKKPEIRYHDKSLAERLPALQYEILSASAKYLKAGGRILYSTCTLRREENERVVEKFLNEHENFAPLDFEVTDKNSEIIKSERGTLTLLPNRFSGDGFFISVLKRKN